MNCKQGDLAVIVKSYAGNEGKIVTCVRRATTEELIENKMSEPTSPWWVVDRMFPTLYGRYKNFVPDSCLRPLRDNDGEDEMIRIAGKPEKATQ